MRRTLCCGPACVNTCRLLRCLPGLGMSARHVMPYRAQQGVVPQHKSQLPQGGVCQAVGAAAWPRTGLGLLPPDAGQLACSTGCCLDCAHSPQLYLFLFCCPAAGRAGATPLRTTRCSAARRPCWRATTRARSPVPTGRATCPAATASSSPPFSSGGCQWASGPCRSDGCNKWCPLPAPCCPASYWQPSSRRLELQGWLLRPGHCILGSRMVQRRCSHSSWPLRAPTAPSR